MANMRAVLYRRFGPPDVLQLEEVQRPTPESHEVLVRIRATTVTAEEPRQRAFRFSGLEWLPARFLFGFRRPRKPILGFELSGEIEEVGEAVTLFRLGDRVYGLTGLSFGAYAEYKCLPEDGLLVSIPETVTYEEAAALPNGGLTALIYLRDKAQLQPGEKILVYGASGSVGVAAVQLAKHMGAEVVAVCSGRNAELVRGLGADEVIDYEKEKFTDRSDNFDVVFDTVGKTTLSESLPRLRPGGRYLLTVFGVREILAMVKTRWLGKKRVIGTATNFLWRRDDLELLADLAATGDFKSVIDRTYPLDQAARAHSYVEEGHKKGNVVLVV